MEALLRLYQDDEMRRALGLAGKETMTRIGRERRYERALLGALNLTV